MSGEVQLINVSTPIFVAILAKMFLSENCCTFQFAIMAITIIGVIIVIRPPFLMDLFHEEKDGDVAASDIMHFYLGVLTLGGALVQAVAIVATKALKVKYNIFHITSIWYHMHVLLSKGC